MKNTPLIESILEWLKNGKDNPDTLVDVRWVISNEDRDEDGRLRSFEAIFPEFPISLIIIDLSIDPEHGLNIIRMVIETGIQTLMYDVKDREYIYRSVLQLARNPIVKYYLYGENLNLAIVVDLDAKSLSKEEFNDALAFIIAGTIHLYEKLGAQDLLKKELVDHLLILIKKYIEQGWTREQLIEFLVNKGGMPKDDAIQLINKLMGGSQREGMLYV